MVIAFYTRQLSLLNAAVESAGLSDCPNLRVVTVDSSQGRCEALEKLIALQYHQADT